VIVTIKTLSDSPTTYLALAHPWGDPATYLLCFTDDIFGAMSLHDFTEMLRKHFHLSEVELTYTDCHVSPDTDALLRLLHRCE
jgi:hypothetical protein